MEVIATRQNPSMNEIVEYLGKNFNDKCSYSRYGLNDNKSLIISKSIFLGAQVWKAGETITVQIVIPNPLLGFLDTLLLGSSFIHLFLSEERNKLEKELVRLLRNKYS